MQLCNCAATCTKVNVVSGPQWPARLRTDREFGNTAAFALFALGDYGGHSNELHERPRLCEHGWHCHPDSWQAPEGRWGPFLQALDCSLWCASQNDDQGGEIEREFRQDVDYVGCGLTPTVVVSPKQNCSLRDARRISG